MKIVKFVNFSAFLPLCRIRQIISSSSLNASDAHSSKDVSSWVPAASSGPVSAHPAAPRPFFSAASGHPADVPANHSEPSSHRGDLTRAPVASAHHQLTRPSNISPRVPPHLKKRRLIWLFSCTCALAVAHTIKLCNRRTWNKSAWEHIDMHGCLSSFQTSKQLPNRSDLNVLQLEMLHRWSYLFKTGRCHPGGQIIIDGTGFRSVRLTARVRADFNVSVLRQWSQRMADG